MKQCRALVRDLEVLNAECYRLTLEEPYLAREARPGQFLHLRTASGFSPLLRRPFSVAGTNPADGLVHLLIRRAGTGTELLSCLQQGDLLDCLGPLGNPFQPGEREPFVLLAGGIGVAPLLFLGEQLQSAGKKVLLFYGAASKEALLPIDSFLPSQTAMQLVTEDGSMGERGMLPDAFQRALSSGLVPGEIFACGPRPLLALLAQKNTAWGYPMQVSLEENMACGIGACQGCAVLLNRDGKKAYERVCREGPVFWSEEVVW